MHDRNLLKLAACVGVVLLLSASGVSAQNVLTNPGFEDGLTGWIAFGNAYSLTSNPPSVVPYEGDGVAQLYGNFSGGFNVSGILQEFAAEEGQIWRLSAKSWHFGGDPMVGVGPPTDNWIVQKIAFFDAANNEICFAETNILDGTFATDSWFDNAEAVGYAPPGTVKMQALILYLQPSFDGGAGFIDNVSLTVEEPEPDLNLLANPGFEGGLTGWTVFGNVFAESQNPPAIVPIGCGLAKMFGNFTGGFNVTGIFQEFPTTEGFEWTMSAQSRHFSGDAMVGVGPPDDNWVVQKIAFFNAADEEIGAAESLILDGTFATDVWHENAPVAGTAPMGTVLVRAFILYLQPAFAGGAAQIDDVKLTVKQNVALDIKPLSCPNPLNVAKRNNNAVLPVALLGEAGFDVNDVDVSTLLLAGVPPIRSSIEDVSTPDQGNCECTTAGADGFDDLTLKFNRGEVAEALGVVSSGDIVELTMTGNLLDGTPIVGSDCVRIIANGPTRMRANLGAVSLDHPKPNPFNPVTRIGYYIPQESFVSLSVYDVRGRLVQRLVSGFQPVGEHVVEWDAGAVPSGIYFSRLEVGDFVETRKMILLK